MSRYRRSLVAGGTFFFTVTLADRRSSLLVTEIDRLRRAYAATAKHLPFETLAICVLPDHLHALWILPPDDADYPRRWNLIKAAFSRGLPAAETRSQSKRAKRDKGIWQRRYWEHQIRDESDLQRHCDYIHYNPVKHGLVSRVQDWPHSSFHRQVREGRLPLDWGGDAVMDGDFGERGLAVALPRVQT